jgi:hypothetical protein
MESLKQIKQFYKNKVLLQNQRIIKRDFDLQEEREILKYIYNNSSSISFDLNKGIWRKLDLLIFYFNGSNDIKKYNNSYELYKGIMMAWSDIEILMEIMELFREYTKIKGLQFAFTTENARKIVEYYSKDYDYNISKHFVKKGEKSFNDYTKLRQDFSLLLNELGNESHYGYRYKEEFDVISYIIEERYKLTNNLILTHATTRLTTEEIEKRYGSQVYKTISKMFNYVPLI